MRFCQPHWDALRAAIAERGLAALVPDTGEKATGAFVSAVTDGPTVDNFDPLMGAMWAIVGNLSAIDMSVLFRDECPVCYGNAAHAEHCTTPGCPPAYYDQWIGYAAADQVTAWKALQG